MERSRGIALVIAFALGAAAIASATAHAQEEDSQPLTLWTSFPAQVVEAGESVTLSLNVKGGSTPPQVARLEMRELPEGWTAKFLGGGRVVKAVYVEPESTATVTLKLDPPDEVEPGTYHFVVAARSETAQVRSHLPIDLIVEEELPPQLNLDVELPTLRGAPGSTITYRATLENESDQELVVSLEADPPTGFKVSFKTSLRSQEVTSLPLKGGSSKDLNIDVTPQSRVEAGEYRVPVRAEAGEASAALVLRTTVTGQPELSISRPDGRVSARATVGRETPLKLQVRNRGSAAAEGVEVSASPPSGWSVQFEPKRIENLPAGESAEATAIIKPSQSAVAGDYMLTVRARTEETSGSTELRITAVTSTLWGIVGVVLIAIAVGVVGLAVVRFGRR